MAKPIKRRDLVAKGAALGGALLLPAARAHAQPAPGPQPAPDPRLAPEPLAFRDAVDAFVGAARPQRDGLLLDAPESADNPSAVPVKLRVTRPITEANHCEELMLLAELNPAPVVCRLRFTAATGTAEASVRVRLSQPQTLHAYARMSDGSVLVASRAVTVGGSGCGM